MRVPWRWPIGVQRDGRWRRFLPARATPEQHRPPSRPARRSRRRSRAVCGHRRSAARSCRRTRDRARARRLSGAARLRCARAPRRGARPHPRATLRKVVAGASRRSTRRAAANAASRRARSAEPRRRRRIHRPARARAAADPQHGGRRAQRGRAEAKSCASAAYQCRRAPIGAPAVCPPGNSHAGQPTGPVCSTSRAGRRTHLTPGPSGAQSHSCRVLGEQFDRDAFRSIE